MWMCVAGQCSLWHQNDFPEWRNRTKDCCRNVLWCVGSTAEGDISWTKASQRSWKFLKATQWSYLKKRAIPQVKPKRDVRPSSWSKIRFCFFQQTRKKTLWRKIPSSSTPSTLLETTGRNCPHTACSKDIVTLLSWIMTADSNCESSTNDKLTQKMTTTQARSCKSPTSRQFTVSFTFTSQEFDSALSAELESNQYSRIPQYSNQRKFNIFVQRSETTPPFTMYNHHGWFRKHGHQLGLLLARKKRWIWILWL